MKKIAASYIFPIISKPLKQGILVLSDTGEVLDIIDTGGNLHETSSMEFYNGIIVPGFINAHCHLELSYMKGIIEEATGLPDFLKQLSIRRINVPKNIEEIINETENEMKAEGIVAVGDISNDDFSFNTKKRSPVYYHTFVEVYWPSTDRAIKVFSKGEKLYKQLIEMGLSSSIVPHTPYSVSPELFELALNHCNQNKGIFSMHNQETYSENELFKNRTGAISDLFRSLGADMSSIKITGKSSFQSVFQYIPRHRNVLLIHNIFTEQNDITLAKNELNKLFWVLCPNSNLIIENRLPDIDLFIRNNLNLAIGTDSYASNFKLSILEELKTIAANYPDLSLELLLQWATLNGARALDIDKKYGSFEKGKFPGVNLITGIDFENMRLTKNSKVKVLV